MAVLRNKTAFSDWSVTGKLGRTTASALAEAGGRTSLVYYGRSVQDAESFVADIRSNEGRADAIRADLGTPEGATLLAKEVSSIVGGAIGCARVQRRNRQGRKPQRSARLFRIRQFRCSA